jgi:pimeloyl-ACP methyl ester carboxylesterase
LFGFNNQVHIYGTSLGGFLAQIFAQHRPRRVKSLILSNTFLETHKFAAAMPWAPMYVFSFSLCEKSCFCTSEFLFSVQKGSENRRKEIKNHNEMKKNSTGCTVCLNHEALIEH